MTVSVTWVLTLIMTTLMTFIVKHVWRTCDSHAYANWMNHVWRTLTLHMFANTCTHTRSRTCKQTSTHTGKFTHGGQTHEVWTPCEPACACRFVYLCLCVCVCGSGCVCACLSTMVKMHVKFKDSANIGNVIVFTTQSKISKTGSGHVIQQ